MDTVKTYLDGLFLDEPDTPATKAARKTLEGQMQQDFDTLVAGGMVPAQAAARVISKTPDVHKAVAASQPATRQVKGLDVASVTAYWAIAVITPYLLLVAWG